MYIEHEVRATIHSPIAAVWAVLGSFGDMSWFPGIISGSLIGGDVVDVGSVREMRMIDGTTIRERLDAFGPARSPSRSRRRPSRSTAPKQPSPPPSPRRRRTRPPSSPGNGRFDVADDATRRTVEHLNRDIVWPALIDALASTLGAEHTIDPTQPTDRQEEAGRSCQTHPKSTSRSPSWSW